MVALVIVALAPFAFVKLLVDALVVVAFNVVILPVDAKRFVNVEEIAVSEFANKLDKIFKLETLPVAATIWLAAKFPVVRFVAVVEPIVVEPFV